MREAELRAKIVGYLETEVEGDLLRSIGMIAEAIGAERDTVREHVREMVRKGEVFEPIPRRYLRRERRMGSSIAKHVPERLARRELPDRRRDGRDFGSRNPQPLSWPTMRSCAYLQSYRPFLITPNHSATCALFSTHGPITCLVSKRRVLIMPHQRHPQRYRGRLQEPDLEPDYGIGRKSEFTPIGTRN